MTRIVETETDTPICPHCNKNLNDILAKRIQSTFGVRYVYFCQNCSKVLGMSHRKGFWMG